MRTIVFIDLDATYWSFGKIPPSARQAVLAARENGHVVIANTSRTRGGTMGSWPEEFDGVCCGAGMDITFHGETLLFETLGVERAKAIFEGIDIGRSLVMAEGVKRDYLYSRVPGMEWLGRNFAKRFIGPTYVMGDIRTLDDEGFADIQKYGITFLGGVTPKLLDRIKLPDNVEVYPLRFAFEVADSRYNKATAMGVVREHLGPGWRVVAIGDSANDVGMFQAADVGVAMGNGKKAAKEAADFVTDDLRNDGIYNAFVRLGLV